MGDKGVAKIGEISMRLSGKESPMKKVFIFGYYGFHNIGDEAILEAIVDEFQKVMPEVSLTALSYNAAETSRRYSIEAVSRNRFVEVVRSIGRSHLVMSGGGSILQDVTSSRSLLYYLGIILVGQNTGEKSCFLWQWIWTDNPYA
jgi:polysaccharide pyruvyl transferase WcaK-like protein